MLSPHVAYGLTFSLRFARMDRCCCIFIVYYKLVFTKCYNVFYKVLTNLREEMMQQCCNSTKHLLHMLGLCYKDKVDENFSFIKIGWLGRGEGFFPRSFRDAQHRPTIIVRDELGWI
jgi:hypothetical protein